MESENQTTTRHRIKITGEACLNASCFIGKRQWETGRRQILGQATAILITLLLHPNQRLPHLLSLNRTNGLSIDKKQIVRCTLQSRKFAYSNATSCAQVQSKAILYDPTSLLKQLIDL